MKQIFLSITILLASLSVKAQLAYIPDANFRAFIENNYPNCMVGDSLDTQCYAILDEGYLDVSGLGISDLTGVQYFTEIGDLNCSNNNLTWLPGLPSLHNRLNCSYNNLTSLPDIPNVYYLYCFHNNLTSLPELPEDLEYLRCYNNQLTSLPLLPDGLEQLNAENNQLVELPPLEHLAYLDYLKVSKNQLQVIPPLPDELDQLSADSNNIYCLPVLPEGLSYLWISSNPIECLPNLPNGLNVNVNLPVCTSSNLHDCTFLRPVSGNVYHDQNDNCQIGQSEIGLQNRLIQASNGTTVISDSLGNYQLFLDTGDYSITQMPLPLLQPTTIWDIDCPSVPYQILIDETVDSVSSVDFPNTSVTDCHWLNVDVASSIQRPCFTTNSYHVSYCNYGTDAASNVYIELEFPSSVIPISSSIPWQNIGNGIYQFDIGNLSIDQSGSFNVIDSVSCDAEVGTTTCVRAEIFPHSPCLVGETAWDNSRLEVSAECTGTEVEFTIKNTGTGNMNAASNYRIYENNALLVSNQPIQLNAGASIVVPVSATGKTYRLEADQSFGHPGFSLPNVNLEGCGVPPFSFGQILPTYQDDADDYIEIDCTELTASYDPNDKTVVPAGYCKNNLVHPNDSLLEYRIRFQNTGNDTAFNIEVVDTLPAELLNPATFLSGVSSHPYTVRMHGNGIVTWRFENILLPDSTTNEVGSHGFVKFKIRPQSGLPNGTIINNSAAIYFDFNAAILTNTSFLTISDVEIVPSVENVLSEMELSVYPNPFSDYASIVLDKPLQKGMVEIYDAVGRKLRQEIFTGKSHRIERRGLPSGVYLLSVYDGEVLVRSVRVSVLER